MKALILKEIHELKIGAILASLSFAATFVAAIIINSRSQAWDITQGLSSIGFPILATILGVLQTLPEKKNDRWAYLLHRPLTHQTIFTAKTIAGLSLYLLATIIPSIAILTWLATPGVLPMPFYWPMALPTFADILVGPAYYFAGMIIGLREARWLGSRTFPISLALLASFVSFAIPQFHWAVLCSLIPTTLLAIAARGFFISTGAHSPLPPFARFNLGLSMFITIVGIAAGAIGITLDYFDQYERINTNYTFDHTTQKLLTKTTHSTKMPDNKRTSKIIAIQDITDPQNPIDLPLPKKQPNNQTQPKKQKLKSYYGNIARSNNQSRYRSNSRFFSSYQLQHPIYSSQQKQTAIRWYFSRHEGLLLGYSEKHPHLLKHIISPDGHHTSRDSVTQHFDILGNSQMLQLNNTLYTFDSKNIQLTPLYTIQPNQTVYSYTLQLQNSRYVTSLTNSYRLDFSDSPTPPNETELSVITNSNIEIYKIDPITTTIIKPILTIKNSHDDKIHSHISLTQLRDKTFAGFAHTSSRKTANLKPKPQTSFKRLDPTGALIEERSLPPFKQRYTYSTSQITQPYICGIIPSAFFIIGEAVDLAGIQISSIRRQPFFKRTPFWITVALSIITSILITHLIAKRYGFSKSNHRNWLIANALMGLPGPLVMITIRDWPPRITCDACQNKRPADIETCPACQAPFPQPQPDGTEILAA